MSNQELAPPPAPPFATGGPWIVLSGQVGVDDQWRPVTTSFEDEARAAFSNVMHHLASTSADKSAIVKVTAYLSDFAYFDAYNAVWVEVFGDSAPARTTIQAGLHPPFNVELDVLAYVADRV
ncbi:RidA family protein [Mycolicibacterium nivoides]|uniref:RidA family protein n=1 Tax=Mycolicibacterium nivoides TaxID=2487344 RepID=UPI003C2B31F4